MKVVHRVDRPCNCYDRCMAYEAEWAQSGPELHLGSIVECSCGKQYRLEDHQFDGQVWVWYHPDSGDMSKR